MRAGERTATPNMRIVTKVWREATENGPWTMDKSQTFTAHVYMRVRV
jgi:hypothetical protein